MKVSQRIVTSGLPVKGSILVLVLWAFASRGSQALTVEEAYQAIPHQRTVFNAAEATMPAAESAYLVQLFDAVDLAIVARVEASRGIPIEAAYKSVWTAWGRLKPPAKLKAIQDLFREAITNEQAALAASNGVVNSADSRTSVASQKLHQAYDKLMSLYPNENPENKQAFFDYPCALDFF